MCFLSGRQMAAVCMNNFVFAYTYRDKNAHINQLHYKNPEKTHLYY
jgi:hypothetical protein